MILRSFRWSWVVALALVASCSWLVTPEDAKPKCEIGEDGQDPCPVATYCKDGSCEEERCAQAAVEICADGRDNDCDDKVDEHDDTIPEICDQIDQDCDGVVDEGLKTDEPEDKCDQEDENCNYEIDENHDLDGDGVTWCGDGSLASKDCDNQNRNVAPGKAETCDGLDNDCDGDSDEHVVCSEPGHVCSKGQCLRLSCASGAVICDANKLCVGDECVTTSCNATCGPRERCDPSSFTCVPLPQRANGDACVTDDDCLSGRCIDSIALKLKDAPPRVCGLACCSDGDCKIAGEACYTAGTGARSCLPEAKAALMPAVCARAGDCAAPLTCASAQRTVTTPASSFCRNPGASRALGASCYPSLAEGDRECGSRLCSSYSPFPLGLGRGLCSTPCGTDDDCMPLKAAADMAKVNIKRVACNYVDLGEYDSAASNFLSVCLFPPEDPGRIPAGGACKVNADCSVGVCFGAASTKSGQCAPTCCSDAHCALPARCRPVARGTNRFEMRCVQVQ